MKIQLLLTIAILQSIYANDNYYLKNYQKDKLIIKLNSSNQTIDKYLQEFNLTLEKRLGKNLYLLKTTDKSLVLDIVKQLHEKKDVEYVHPDYIKKIRKR